MRSQPVNFGFPLTVVTIVIGTGLALWLAMSVLGRMKLEAPDIIPSVNAPALPTSGAGTGPGSTAVPADNLDGPGTGAAPPIAPEVPAPATAPAPATGPVGPALPGRPQRIYGDMPIDPPLVNPVPRPVEE